MKTPSIDAGSLLNILRIDSSSNFATGYIECAAFDSVAGCSGKCILIPL